MLTVLVTIPPGFTTTVAVVTLNPPAKAANAQVFIAISMLTERVAGRPGAGSGLRTILCADRDRAGVGRSAGPDPLEEGSSAGLASAPGPNGTGGGRALCGSPRPGLELEQWFNF